MSSAMTSSVYFGTKSLRPLGTVFGTRFPKLIRRCDHLRPVALKETESIQDWRIKRMVDVSQRYFHDLWSQGDLAVADEILTDAFVHKNTVWDLTGHPVVGPKAMKEFVQAVRQAYPDLWLEIEEIGVSDTNHIFVKWSGQGTNLGQRQGHKASYHESHVSGVDMISFNEDRSKIGEVQVFREPMHEEVEDLKAQGEDHNILDLKLERIHFDT